MYAAKASSRVPILKAAKPLTPLTNGYASVLINYESIPCHKENEDTYQLEYIPGSIPADTKYQCAPGGLGLLAREAAKSSGVIGGARGGTSDAGSMADGTAALASTGAARTAAEEMFALTSTGAAGTAAERTFALMSAGDSTTAA